MTRWRGPVLLLACGTFASGTDVSVIAGILPGIAGDLHVSVAAAGQMVTLFALAYALGSPLLMAFVVGGSAPHRVLAAAIGAFALANGLAALAPSIAVLGLARVLAALLAGIYVPSAAAAASALAGPEQRGRALAVVLGGASLGTALGVPVGVWLAGHSGWRASFGFVSAIALLALAGILLRFPAAAPLPRVALRARLAPLARAEVVRVLAVTLLAMTAGAVTYTYVGPLFAGPGAVGPGWIAPLLFVFGCGSLAGSWLGGYGADRWGARPTAAVALAVFCANFALLGIAARSPAGAVACMFVWGVAGWGLLPPQQARLIRLAPDAAPIVLSLNASAVYLGIGTGAAIGGLVMTTLGPTRLAFAAAACAAAALLCLLTSPRRSEGSVTSDAYASVPSAPS